MTNEDLSFFKELLLQKRHETMEELEELRATSKEKEASGEKSQYPSHMAELGTDAQEQEKTALFAHRLNSYITYLNEALYRIENGTYGICKSCNKEIAKERLEAVPQTELCVDCKLKSK